MESKPAREPDARSAIITPDGRRGESTRSRRRALITGIIAFGSAAAVITGVILETVFEEWVGAAAAFSAGLLAAIVHITATAVLNRFERLRREEQAALETELHEARKLKRRGEIGEQRLQRIVDDVCSQESFSAAVTTLFKHLVPAVRHGFVGLFSVDPPRGSLQKNRGLSRTATHAVTLDDSLIQQLERSDYAHLHLDDLQKTQFAESLVMSDRHKVRELHLFRIGNAESSVGIIASTQLFPSPADLSAVDHTEWSRDVFTRVADHLAELRRNETEAAGSVGEQFSQELTADHKEFIAKTQHNTELPKLFLKVLRQKLCVDRVSVYRHYATTTPFDDPEPIVAEGVPVPPSIAAVWKSHEKRLLPLAGQPRTHTLSIDALKQFGIDSLISTAVVFPMMADEKTFAAMIITHRGRWQLGSERQSLIAGCAELLVEQFTNPHAKSPQDSVQKSERQQSPRDEFLSVISHELRTPVSGILGMTELALNTDMTDEQREYLNLVRSSSVSLMAMLNDVLDLSKLEAGGMELERIPFELHETVADILKSNAVKAHEKGLEICLEIAEDVPPHLIGDPLRLRQVIVNLVGNASKFTEAGEIDIIIDAVEQTAERCRLRFRVRDTGIGIPPEAAERIFEKYTQTDTSIARRFGGTGLGLPICREIVERMGGRIGVESEPGKGSTFHFTADFGIATTSHAVRLLNHGGKRENLLILIIDDHPTTRRLLSETASAVAGECREFPTAASAISEVRELCGDPRGHIIILLDAHLQSAEQLLKLIAENEKSHRPDVILLKSVGTSMPAFGEESSVVAQTILKPTYPAELLEAIVSLECKWNEKRDVTSFAMNDTPLTAAPRYPGLRVLLAEDNAVNQFLACSHLETLGCEIRVVESGRAAVDALPTGEFDLVLMDLMMPVLDGITATMEIRHAEKNTDRHVAIVALSAHNRPEDRKRCRDAGFDGYLTKPISCEELEMAIDSLIDGGLITPPVQTDSFETNRSPVTDSGPEQELLDELLEIFRDIAPALMDRLRDGIATGTATEVREAAHSLKGAVSCLEIDDLEELAYQLEKMGENNRLETADATFRQFETAVNALLTGGSA